MTKTDEKPALAKSSAKPAAKKASAADKHIAEAPPETPPPGKNRRTESSDTGDKFPKAPWRQVSQGDTGETEEPKAEPKAKPKLGPAEQWIQKQQSSAEKEKKNESADLNDMPDVNAEYLSELTETMHVILHCDDLGGPSLLQKKPLGSPCPCRVRYDDTCRMLM